MSATDTPTPREAIERDDPPTPEVLEAWSESEIEQYNRLKEQDLREGMATGPDADVDAATAALLQAAEESIPTEEVDLTAGLDTDEQICVEVKTTIPGAITDEFRRATQNRDTEAAVEAICQCLAELIVEPEEYARPEVWREVYRQAGETVLDDYLANAAEPARNVKSFREDA